jgi:Trypsin-like serine proteases, typically periplasmic, contain C-terminal PDZ domain
MAVMTGMVGPPVGPVFEALVEFARKSVVSIRTGDGQGSGVVWTEDGIIITNDHVARDDRVEVELVDGRRVEGRVFARDPANDLAILRVPYDDLTAAVIGDSRALRLGELLIAVGHPLGVRDTATLGIVSGTGTVLRKGRQVCDILQADIQLLPGNSGGPLLDAQGRVVGIASMILSPGISLAVPTHVIQQFIASLPSLAGRRSYAGRIRM